MGLRHKRFSVAEITDTKMKIVNENKNRELLYLFNRGDNNIYIGNFEDFEIATSGLMLAPKSVQVWESPNCLSNEIYAVCATGESSNIEIEEA